MIGNLFQLIDRYMGGADSTVTLDQGVISGVPFVLVFRINYPTFDVWRVDRERWSSGSAAIGSTAGAAGSLRLGSTWSYGSGPMYGRLAEVIIFDSVLTDAEVEQTIKHLAWKWEFGEIPEP